MTSSCKKPFQTKLDLLGYQFVDLNAIERKCLKNTIEMEIFKNLMIPDEMVIVTTGAMMVDGSLMVLKGWA